MDGKVILQDLDLSVKSNLVTVTPLLAEINSITAFANSEEEALVDTIALFARYLRKNEPVYSNFGTVYGRPTGEKVISWTSDRDIVLPRTVSVQRKLVTGPKEVVATKRSKGTSPLDPPAISLLTLLFAKTGTIDLVDGDVRTNVIVVANIGLRSVFVLGELLRSGHSLPVVELLAMITSETPSMARRCSLSVSNLP